MDCPNCGNEKQGKGVCCRKEIGRLHSKLNTQSREIERLQDEADKLRKRNDRLELEKSLIEPIDEIPVLRYG